jgi:PRTRC genetic system protein E
MFKELNPYLPQRAVLLTVTHIEDDQIRERHRQKLKDGENAALTTPLTVTGTADELDRDLPATLVNFVSAHLELRNTLDRAKTEMDAAAKRARQRPDRRPGQRERENRRSRRQPAPPIPQSRRSR